MAIVDGAKKALSADKQRTNPCRRLTFIDDAGVQHNTNCNTPKCDDCGPIKAGILWDSIRDTFGSQANLLAIDEEQYLKVRNRIRQMRHRHGVKYQYVSWYIGGGTRMVLTDAPLDEAPITMVAAIKKSIITCYTQGLAALRKSWDITSVTLLRISITKSVTGALRFLKRVTRKEERDAIEEQERIDRIISLGYDPDQWEVGDEDGTLISTINLGKPRYTD